MPERKNFTKQDIGGEILPILTSGLYRNKLDTLREYIQNAIDAKCKKIELIINPDTITIYDDGTGMDFETARKAIKLGISEKNPKTSVGFRGIGIYSAYNVCDCLDIYTRAESDSQCNLIHIDFKKARAALAEDIERKKQNLPQKVYLEKLLEDTVYVAIDTENTLAKMGTKAIMSDLLDEVYEELNKWDEVEQYLRDVVPLKFRDDFKSGPIIEEKFREQDYNVVSLMLQVGDKRGDIRRPYYDDMFTHGGKHLPKFFDIKENKIDFGFAWVCLNDARQVLRDTKLRGLLIKKFGFSVSGRSFLEPYFARPVFNRRVTGEIIIRNEGLVPNAARSDFEHNSTRQAFMRALPRFIKDFSDWADEIQEREKAEEVLSEMLGILRPINESLPSERRDKEALLRRNLRLHYVETQITSKHRAAILKEIAPDDYNEAINLLRECQKFVKTSLTERQVNQKKVEEQVIAAIQREASPKTATEETAEGAPQDILELIKKYGIEITTEVEGIIKLVDENYLKPNLDKDDYAEMIASLTEHIEERT